LAPIRKLRADEPQLGATSNEEQSWLAKAFDCLKQIQARRGNGRPGNNACCVFDFGQGYMQFLVPFDNNQLLCEAVSAKSNNQLANIFTSNKEGLLRAWPGRH
jgi:hypothetical protein